MSENNSNKVSQSFVEAISKDNHLIAERHLKKILKKKVKQRVRAIVDEINK